jgi:hypothetical protein
MNDNYTMVKKIFKNVIDILLLRNQTSFFQKWLSAFIWCMIVIHLITFGINLYFTYFWDPFPYHKIIVK